MPTPVALPRLTSLPRIVASDLPSVQRGLDGWQGPLNVLLRTPAPTVDAVTPAASTYTVQDITGSTTVTTYNEILAITALSADTSIVLPTAVGMDGAWFLVADQTDAPQSYLVTVRGTGGETIGGLSKVLVWDAYQSLLLVAEGGVWTVAEGGASLALDPRTITGIVGWYAADRGVTLASVNRVSTWADQSGAGYNATQATNGIRPRFDPMGLTGRPVLYFDGTDYLTNAAVTLASGSLTIFAACARAWQTSVSQSLYSIGTTFDATNGLDLNLCTGSVDIYVAPNIAFYGSGYSAAPKLTANSMVAQSDTMQVITIEAGAGAVTVRLNGSDQTTTAVAGAVTGRTALLTIGGVNSIPELTARVGEIIAIDGTVTTTQRAAVERYLLAKYGARS